MVGAVVFAVLLAVVGVDAGAQDTAAGQGPASSAHLTARGPGLGELVVPTRPSATAGWAEPGSAKTRPYLHAATVSAAAALLVLLVAALRRRRPGPPWHHLRPHSAVLRAPPPLLLQA